MLKPLCPYVCSNISMHQVEPPRKNTSLCIHWSKTKFLRFMMILIQTWFGSWVHLDPLFMTFPVAFPCSCFQVFLHSQDNLPLSQAVSCSGEPAREAHASVWAGRCKFRCLHLHPPTSEVALSKQTLICLPHRPCTGSASICNCPQLSNSKLKLKWQRFHTVIQCQIGPSERGLKDL